MFTRCLEEAAGILLYCDCWERGGPCPLSELTCGPFTEEDTKSPPLRQTLCGGSCPMDDRYEAGLRARAAYLKRLLVSCWGANAEGMPWPAKNAPRPDPYDEHQQRHLNAGT